MAGPVSKPFDNLIESESKLLEITLNVLRSDTDWADFLSSWLEDYGPKILSQETTPLVPEVSSERALPGENALFYIN